MGKVATLWEVGRTFGLRDGFLRFSYELQRASGLMSHRMQSAAGWDRWQLQRIAPKTSAEDLLNRRRQGGHPFFFSDARNLAVELKKVLGASGEESVLAEADRILTGELPYFGGLAFANGFPPKWFVNPVTSEQVSPDRQWTTMRFASKEYGDLKFILEPSRFLFSYPLIRAYAISGHDRFPEGFWRAVEDWASRNPPMSGPLWICGQESSLRILAWSFALYGFLDSPTTSPARVALLLSMIAAHAWRIEQTVGYARSQRSNHLFSEAVALWTVGTLSPELTRAAEWQKQGAQLLREAVLDQITPEGASLQDSFNYQRMILHLLLWTIRLAEVSKVNLAPEIRERTGAALSFIENFVDSATGRAPNHGSNDGSNILPLADCDYGDYRPLLALGRCILRHPVGLPPGPWDEAALWLCGPAAGQAKAKIDPAESANEIAASAGYHRIGTANSWALVRAGRYTRRPFQADQLHVDLWWRGLNLARDPGTYLYNGEPPWNNGFAGTAVHNTVTVDRRDQMKRAGRFLWVQWAQASGKSFYTTASALSANCLDRFEGEHDGYRSEGVTHRRMVQCVTEDAWVVVDDLVGSDQQNTTPHELRLHWLLPDLPFEVVTYFPFRGILSSKNTQCRWSIFASQTGSGAVMRCGKSLTGASFPNDAREKEEDQLLGWESPTYGERRPAISLQYRVKAQLPVRIVTVILADEGINLSQRDDQLILSRNAAEVFRVGQSSEH